MNPRLHNIIKASIVLAALTSTTGCGMVIGTTSYWKEYREALREVNTAEHPGNMPEAEAQAKLTE